jgi:hypothetical protein
MTMELLESHSFPLTNELAEVGRQTYEEAQDDLSDENVISKENTWTVKRFKRNLQQNYWGCGLFWKHDFICDHSAKVECGVEDVML